MRSHTIWTRRWSYTMRGHIRKRGKKYAIVISLGADEVTGKYKYKWFSGYSGKKEAEADLPKKLMEVAAGAHREKSGTFGEYMEQWLETKQTQVRPDTYRSYKWLVSKHIIPKLGKLQLEKLTPAQLQVFYAKLAQGDKPLSNRSIQYAHTLIKEALDRALKWGMVVRNVAEAVDPPRAERNHGETWSPEQTVEFLSLAAGTKYWVAFEIAIYTGMRKGEILALRWRDVDLDNAVAHVTRSLTFVDGKPVFQAPKTERSRRAVALPHELVTSLKRHKAQQAAVRLQMRQAYVDHDLVVPRLTGEPLHPKTLDDTWYRLLKKSGLPKIRFHDLRHTHASLLLQQGVHPKIVSERLGHSNVNITLDTYSHVLPGLQQEAASTFGAALEQAKKKVK